MDLFFAKSLSPRAGRIADKLLEIGGGPAVKYCLNLQVGMADRRRRPVQTSSVLAEVAIPAGRRISRPASSIAANTGVMPHGAKARRGRLIGCAAMPMAGW